jgi:hypothetical protein
MYTVLGDWLAVLAAGALVGAALLGLRQAG